MEKTKDNKTAVILIGLLLITLVATTGLAVAWINTPTELTIKLAMDKETREYLVEHDYCIAMENPPYNSNKSDIMFAGDCKYLNYTLLNFE